MSLLEIDIVLQIQDRRAQRQRGGLGSSTVTPK
jgi:hypothetical protein